MNDESSPAIRTVADAYLATLGARGVDWLFANAGTDFAPIIEALARAAQDGCPVPQAVAVPHETVAVGMAHGYWLATGRLQAVMVHVNVGTANALAGLMNACRSGVPMLFASGRTPITEDGHVGSRDLPIHWGQEMRDQGALVREHVKWDYELRYGDQVATVVQRAMRIAESEPTGPVYLSLPREVLAAPWSGTAIEEAGSAEAATAPAPDGQAIQRAAELLAAAQRPLVISACRRPGALAGLAQIAERFALPVVEHWSPCSALSTEHPMHAGFESHGLVADADALLVLDAPVPWIPGRVAPPDGCAVIHVGPDPLFRDIPLRGHETRLAVTSAVGPALAALDRALEERLGAGGLDALSARREALARRHQEERAARRSAAQPGAGDALSRGYVSRVLAELGGGDAWIFGELGCDPGAMTLPQAGTYFGISVAGALGWALPAALGAQLAERDRLIVAAVGDGSYTFANPVACHQTAASLDLPVLTVVFNNQGWRSVRLATLALYPRGSAARSERMPLVSTAPAPRYDRIVEASGGHGERVERAAELPAALKRALRAVRDERRQALVDVVLPPLA